MKAALALALFLVLPQLVFADVSMPSDALVQKEMAHQQTIFNEGLNNAQKLVFKPIVPSTNIEPPSLMTRGFNSLIHDAQSAASKVQPPTRNRRSLMLALTLSMPDYILSEYAKQAEESGARIILRGVPEGSSVPQVAAMIARINRGAKAEWSIDPPLFRRFKLDKVPALILVDDESAQKLEKECAPVSSFLEVDGEVSIRQGLAIMAVDRSPLGTVAAKRLEKIENGQAE